MRLASIDWIIIAVFIALPIVIGALVSRRAGASSESYFLASRNLPWWLLGFSMVATTFAADTPLLVTDIVRNNGVAGNWVWWAMLLTGMLTTFVYARLWRRAGVMTDLEFYELRYSGKPAAALRAFRAVYLGLFFNVLVMATVSLAAIKISAVIFGATPLQTLLVAGTVTAVFASMGGLRGVIITDLILFATAMTGAVAAAWAAISHPDVAGLQGLFAHPNVSDKLDFLPDFSNTDYAIAVFIVPLAVQWWASWYPGAEPGGGGYVAQRMLAAKNEDHAVGAVLLFQLAHYALRPWPWIIVGLASLVVFPDLDSIRAAFPDVDANIINHDFAYPAMLTFLPAGLLGLVAASLVSAYISTMSTQVNWGSSYLVHDVYHRFVNPAADERRLVRLGRISTVLLTVLSCAMALALDTALQAFSIILTIGAGTGLLFILRWFWWRINAWSEIAAMVISFVAALYFNMADLPGWSAWQKMLAGVAVTTAGWLGITLLTPAADRSTLSKFYQAIGPGGPGWSPVAEDQSDNHSDRHGELARGIASMLLGSIGVYALLFAIGYLLYGNTGLGLGLFGIAVIAFAAIHRLRYTPRYQ